MRQLCLFYTTAEMKHYAGSYLNDSSGRLLYMNKKHKRYLRVFTENGKSADSLNDNYKKHTKKIFSGENLENIVLVKHNQKLETNKLSLSFEKFVW